MQTIDRVRPFLKGLQGLIILPCVSLACRRQPLECGGNQPAASDEDVQKVLSDKKAWYTLKQIMPEHLETNQERLKYIKATG